MRRERALRPCTVVPLGEAWAGSSANVTAFRCEGLLSLGNTQLAAFYAQDGAVMLARRALPGTRVDLVRLTEGGADALPWDAHRSISLGVDATGAIHLAYGAHASALRLLRGGAGLALDGFADPEPVPTGAPSAATYPMFLRAGTSGSLMMLYREGLPDSGDLRLRRFDLAAGRWNEAAAPLLEGQIRGHASGPYLNRPVIGRDGTLFGFVVWRLRLPDAAAGRVVNAGIDLVAFRGDPTGAETWSGLVLPMPAGAAHLERVVAVPLGSDLMNQGGAALDPAGIPAAVTWWREPPDAPPQFRLVHRAGGLWRTSVASGFATDFTLAGSGTLPLPHSRPHLLFAPDGRALVLFRSAELGGALAVHILSPPDFGWPAGERVILCAEDLGHYEPVVDAAAWSSRARLSAFVQRCRQGQGDAPDGHADTAPCCIMEWEAAALLG